MPISDQNFTVRLETFEEAVKGDEWHESRLQKKQDLTLSAHGSRWRIKSLFPRGLLVGTNLIQQPVERLEPCLYA